MPSPIQDDLTAEILSIDKELNELGMEIHQSPIKNLPSASIKKSKSTNKVVISTPSKSNYKLFKNTVNYTKNSVDNTYSNRAQSKSVDRSALRTNQETKSSNFPKENFIKKINKKLVKNIATNSNKRSLGGTNFNAYNTTTNIKRGNISTKSKRILGFNHNDKLSNVLTSAIETVKKRENEKASKVKQIKKTFKTYRNEASQTILDETKNKEEKCKLSIKDECIDVKINTTKEKDDNEDIKLALECIDVSLNNRKEISK